MKSLTSLRTALDSLSPEHNSCSNLIDTVDGMMSMGIIMIKMDRLRIHQKKIMDLMMTTLAPIIQVMKRMSFRRSLVVLENIMKKKMKTPRITSFYKELLRIYKVSVSIHAKK